MASSKENCQNCLQTFYTQSMCPLELVDFKFGGQILTLIGCFMESPSTRPVNPDCPKICRTCLEQLKTTFVGSEHSLTKRSTTRRPFYMCATCSEFFPANVMMSMQLTVFNHNKKSVKLIDCYKTCSDQPQVPSEGNLMVCLACVSKIIENFKESECHGKASKIFEIEDLMPVYKVEPEITYDIEFEQPVTKIECPDDEYDGDNQSMGDSTDIPIVEVKSKFKPESPPIDNFVKCKTEPDLPIVKYSESSSIRKKGSSFLQKRVKSKKSSSASAEKRAALSNRYDRYDAMVECAGCGCHKRKSQLERHYISKHYKGRSYSCHHCPYFRTLSRSRITAHLYTTHFPGNNQCKICQKEMPNYRALQTHLQKHEPITSIQCDGCKQVFSRHQTYYLHVQANPLLFNCSECDAGFHTVRALDKHMETAHKKVYTCPICQLPLHLLLTFNTHMWKQHGVRTKPRCRYCGQEFESTEQLAAHRQSEHKPLKAKNIVCELCGKKYDTQYKLNQHIRASHNKKSTGQLFTCPQCPKQYKGKIAMAHHIRRVHLNERSDNGKMYPCTKCSLTFLKRQFLEGHMLCHNTENRPFFQCMQCGIAYTRRQKLEVHKNKCPNRAAPVFSASMY